jgi:magnesium transporter
MNFSDMAEYHWKFGQPFSIVLMLLFAIVPYVVFKRMRWL